MRRFFLPALVVTAAVLTVASSARAQHDDYDDGPRHYDSTFSSKHQIASGGTMRVQNLNGSIEVDASDNGTTSIEAIKSWRRGDPADVRIVVEPGNNGVTVCALWSDEKDCNDHGSRNYHGNRHNDVSVHFMVHVAKGVKVDLNTVNGSVDVRGVTASVDAETVNGRVEVATLGGPVNVHTVNGNVRATIEHLINSAEPLELSTVNGSVQLDAPGDLNAVVDAETTNGGIESDFPLTINKGMIGKHIHGTIGQGGRSVELHTTNGSVRLKKLG